jgi:hypothetical protein
MPDPIFDAVLQDLGSQVARSTDSDLLGFQIDLDAALADDDLLEEVTVERVSATATITASATLRATASTLAQVQDLLYHIWQRVCYHDFQATSLDLHPDCAELRFATASTPHLALTGSIRIGGAHYQRLHRKGR